MCVLMLLLVADVLDGGHSLGACMWNMQMYKIYRGNVYQGGNQTVYVILIFRY